MEPTKRSITVVAGVSGSGKSTFALRYLANAPVAVRFIFDPDDEYSDRLQLPQSRDAYELQVQLCQGWVLFSPHHLFDGRLDAAFSFFCDWAYEYSDRLPGRKVLLVEEAWKYVTTRKQPVELEKCVRGGRHGQLDCMFNTQTPGQLHEVVRNECTELVCFSLQDDKSLEWPKAKGFDPAEVKALPDLHFIARNLRSRGELRGAIKI